MLARKCPIGHLKSCSLYLSAPYSEKVFYTRFLKLKEKISKRTIEIKMICNNKFKNRARIEMSRLWRQRKHKKGKV